MQANLETNQQPMPGTGRLLSSIVKALALTVGLSAAATAEPLQLRIGPSFSYPVTTDIPSDTALIPIERQLDWLYVQAGGYRGWIYLYDLENSPHINRPEPLQFRNVDENAPQVEFGFSSESALELGVNFSLMDQDAAVRLTSANTGGKDWHALEAGIRSPFSEGDNWSWDGFLGVGVGKNGAGSKRWDNTGDAIMVPLVTATTDINWNIDYKVSIGARVQLQQALSGNSANHGALALVWKIRF